MSGRKKCSECKARKRTPTVYNVSQRAQGIASRLDRAVGDICDFAALLRDKSGKPLTDREVEELSGKFTELLVKVSLALSLGNVELLELRKTLETVLKRELQCNRKCRKKEN